MPDYTKQLNEIVRLLSRPGVSPWLLSAFSVILGVVGGAVGRAIEPWIADFSKRSRMRRVLYSDICSMFSNIGTGITFWGPGAAGPTEAKIPPFQEKVLAQRAERTGNEQNTVRDAAFGQLVRSLNFEAESYLDSNRDVFMQLGERPATKHIYNLLHKTAEDGAVQMPDNCARAEWMLGKYIRDSSLPEKHFRRYAPKNQGDSVISRVTRVYDHSMKRQQERQQQNEEYLRE